MLVFALKFYVYFSNLTYPYLYL